MVDVVEATTEFSFEVPASRSNDTEPNRPVVFEEQVVAFAVVHYHRVRLVNVRIGPSSAVIFVVVIRFDFTECSVSDELTGVFDVIGVVNDT